MAETYSASRILLADMIGLTYMTSKNLGGIADDSEIKRARERTDKLEGDLRERADAQGKLLKQLSDLIKDPSIKKEEQEDYIKHVSALVKNIVHGGHKIGEARYEYTNADLVGNKGLGRKHSLGMSLSDSVYHEGNLLEALDVEGVSDDRKNWLAEVVQTVLKNDFSTDANRSANELEEACDKIRNVTLDKLYVRDLIKCKLDEMTSLANKIEGAEGKTRVARYKDERESLLAANHKDNLDLHETQVMKNGIWFARHQVSTNLDGGVIIGPRPEIPDAPQVNANAPQSPTAGATFEELLKKVEDATKRANDAADSANAAAAARAADAGASGGTATPAAAEMGPPAPTQTQTETQTSQQEAYKYSGIKDAVIALVKQSEKLKKENKSLSFAEGLSIVAQITGGKNYNPASVKMDLIPFISAEFRDKLKKYINDKGELDLNRPLDLTDADGLKAIFLPSIGYIAAHKDVAKMEANFKSYNEMSPADRLASKDPNIELFRSIEKDVDEAVKTTIPQATASANPPPEEPLTPEQSKAINDQYNLDMAREAGFTVAGGAAAIVGYRILSLNRQISRLEAARPKPEKEVKQAEEKHAGETAKLDTEKLKAADVELKKLQDELAADRATTPDGALTDETQKQARQQKIDVLANKEKERAALVKDETDAREHLEKKRAELAELDNKLARLKKSLRILTLGIAGRDPATADPAVDQKTAQSTTTLEEDRVNLDTLKEDARVKKEAFEKSRAESIATGKITKDGPLTTDLKKQEQETIKAETKYKEAQDAYKAKEKTFRATQAAEAEQQRQLQERGEDIMARQRARVEAFNNAGTPEAQRAVLTDIEKAYRDLRTVDTANMAVDDLRLHIVELNHLNQDRTGMRQALLSHYGPPGAEPARTPYEIPSRGKIAAAQQEIDRMDKQAKTLAEMNSKYNKEKAQFDKDGIAQRDKRHKEDNKNSSSSESPLDAEKREFRRALENHDMQSRLDGLREQQAAIDHLQTNHNAEKMAFREASAQLVVHTAATREELEKLKEKRAQHDEFIKNHNKNKPADNAPQNVQDEYVRKTAEIKALSDRYNGEQTRLEAQLRALGKLLDVHDKGLKVLDKPVQAGTWWERLRGSSNTQPATATPDGAPVHPEHPATTPDGKIYATRFAGRGLMTGYAAYNIFTHHLGASGAQDRNNTRTSGLYWNGLAWDVVGAGVDTNYLVKDLTSGWKAAQALTAGTEISTRLGKLNQTWAIVSNLGKVAKGASISSGGANILADVTTGVAMVGSTAIDYKIASLTGDARRAARTTGGAVGGGAGVLAGAVAGTLIGGPVGTVVGGVVGFGGMYFGGKYGGELGEEHWLDNFEDKFEVDTKLMDAWEIAMEDGMNQQLADAIDTDGVKGVSAGDLKKWLAEREAFSLYDVDPVEYNKTGKISSDGLLNKLNEPPKGIDRVEVQIPFNNKAAAANPAEKTDTLRGPASPAGPNPNKILPG